MIKPIKTMFEILGTGNLERALAFQERNNQDLCMYGDEWKKTLSYNRKEIAFRCHMIMAATWLSCAGHDTDELLNLLD